MKFRDIIIGFIACTIMFGAIVAVANPGIMREVFYGVRVSVDSRVQHFENDMTPFITDGRTFLPVRGIAESLGLEVNFDQAQNIVYLTTASAPQEPEFPPMIGEPPPEPMGEPFPTYSHPLAGAWSPVSGTAATYLFSPDGTGLRISAGDTESFTWISFVRGTVLINDNMGTREFNYTISGGTLSLQTVNQDGSTSTHERIIQTGNELIGTWVPGPDTLSTLTFVFNTNGTGNYGNRLFTSEFTWSVQQPGIIQMVFPEDGIALPGTQNRHFFVDGNTLHIMRYEPPWRIAGTHVRQ